MLKKQKRRSENKSVSFAGAEIIEPGVPKRQHTCLHCSATIHCIGSCTCLRSAVLNQAKGVMRPNMLYFCSKAHQLEFKPKKKSWLW